MYFNDRSFVDEQRCIMNFGSREGRCNGTPKPHADTEDSII